MNWLRRLFRRRRGPPPGVWIRLDRSELAMRFTVGQMLECPTGLALKFMGAPFATGTIPNEVLVVAVDYSRGRVKVSAR